MFGQWMGEDKIIIKKRRNNMIKSFKGNSLTELDKEVNEYLKGFYKGTKEPSLKAMHYFMDKYNNFEKEMKFISLYNLKSSSLFNIVEETMLNIGMVAVADVLVLLVFVVIVMTPSLRLYGWSSNTRYFYPVS